ncbi:hypothetical protein [Brevundimonas bullata]|uniref:hypothetical protein n=1 Tax=Brevundimonas bullata TaxID=13160 RepID=UPI002FDA0A6D
MTDERKQKLAGERAELYAPAPTGGSTMAGLCAGTVSLLGVFVVSGFYGHDVKDHLVLTAVATAVGFLAGVIGYKKVARANRHAVRTERQAIDDGKP